MNLSTWMSGIPDNKSIALVSVPGTHETMAIEGTAALLGQVVSGPGTGNVYCQESDFTLPVQLNAGVRCLDIRFRMYYDHFIVHHGPFYLQSDSNYIFKVCKEFLRSRPSECIIMLVKEEHESEGCTLTFEQIFDTDCLKNEEFSDLFYIENRMPTLGEVRGKIVILRRFPSESEMGIDCTDWVKNGITNHETLYIQDRFHPGATNHNEKRELIYEALNYANDHCDPDKLCINYLSVNCAPDIGKLFAAGVTAGFIGFAVDSLSFFSLTNYREEWALSEGKQFAITPRYWSELMLSTFSDDIASRNDLTGIVMMDYPTTKDIAAIISCNFHKREHDTLTEETIEYEIS